MKNKIFSAFFLVCIIAVFIIISYGFENIFLTKTVRWAEIVIVLSFFAGFVKFIGREFSSIMTSFRNLKESFSTKKTSTLIKDITADVLLHEGGRKNKLPNIQNVAQTGENRSENISKLLNSLVIVVSALTTFILGFVNPNQSRYTFENIVREQPDFLAQTALLFIESDINLSKFPSPKKLALYMSADVSTDFFPTEEMLKKAGISLENYQKLLSENKIMKNPELRNDVGTTFINQNEMKLVKEVKEKVKEASIEIISDMFPVARELKEWFDSSLSSLKTEEIESDSELNLKDFVFSDTVVEGSGAELESWIIGEKENLTTEIDVELTKDMFRYNSFLAKSSISEMVSEKFSYLGSSTLPPESKKRIAAKFLETGITSSPEIKGIIRWIYRYILDPLLSSFIALLLLNMISTVYTKFSMKNYSYRIITVAFVLTLTGLTNQYALLAQKYFPGWHGPLAPGWIMADLAVPVFKALAIGTAAGILFFIAEIFYSAFLAGIGRKK